MGITGSDTRIFLTDREVMHLSLMIGRKNRKYCTPGRAYIWRVECVSRLDAVSTAGKEIRVWPIMQKRKRRKYRWIR